MENDQITSTNTTSKKFPWGYVIGGILILAVIIIVIVVTSTGSKKPPPPKPGSCGAVNCYSCDESNKCTLDDKGKGKKADCSDIGYCKPKGTCGAVNCYSCDGSTCKLDAKGKGKKADCSDIGYCKQCGAVNCYSCDGSTCTLDAKGKGKKADCSDIGYCKQCGAVNCYSCDESNKCTLDDKGKGKKADCSDIGYCKPKGTCGEVNCYSCDGSTCTLDDKGKGKKADCSDIGYCKPKGTCGAVNCYSCDGSTCKLDAKGKGKKADCSDIGYCKQCGAVNCYSCDGSTCNLDDKGTAKKDDCSDIGGCCNNDTVKVPKNLNKACWMGYTDAIQRLLQGDTFYMRSQYYKDTWIYWAYNTNSLFTNDGSTPKKNEGNVFKFQKCTKGSDLTQGYIVPVNLPTDTTGNPKYMIRCQGEICGIHTPYDDFDNACAGKIPTGTSWNLFSFLTKPSWPIGTGPKIDPAAIIQHMADTPTQLVCPVTDNGIDLEASSDNNTRCFLQIAFTAPEPAKTKYYKCETGNCVEDTSGTNFRNDPNCGFGCGIVKPTDGTVYKIRCRNRGSGGSGDVKPYNNGVYLSYNDASGHVECVDTTTVKPDPVKPDLGKLWNTWQIGQCNSKKCSSVCDNTEEGQCLDSNFYYLRPYLNALATDTSLYGHWNGANVFDSTCGTSTCSSKDSAKYCRGVNTGGWCSYAFDVKPESSSAPDPNNGNWFNLVQPCNSGDKNCPTVAQSDKTDDRNTYMNTFGGSGLQGRALTDHYPDVGLFQLEETDKIDDEFTGRF